MVVVVAELHTLKESIFGIFSYVAYLNKAIIKIIIAVGRTLKWPSLHLAILSALIPRTKYDESPPRDYVTKCGKKGLCRCRKITNPLDSELITTEII